MHEGRAVGGEPAERGHGGEGLTEEIAKRESGSLLDQRGRIFQRRDERGNDGDRFLRHPAEEVRTRLTLDLIGALLI